MGNSWLRIWPWLLGLVGLRLLFWVGVFPNPDEAYYWLWGQHLQLSYYDHPPWQGWSQALLSSVPPTPGLLRLPNALSNALLLGTYWHLSRYLYGAARSIWETTAALLMTSPLFFLFLALAWPDHWLVAFSTLSGYALARFFDAYSEQKRGWGWLYLAAITLGLAGLCKYTAVFVGLGGLATIASNRRLWSLWRQPQLYLGLGLLGLLLSPIVLWNLHHDFFSFRYYAERSAGAEQLVFQPLQPLVFLLLCGLILGPIHSWGLVQLLRCGSRVPRQSTYGQLAGWVFGLSTAVFTLLSTVSVAIYYWNILAYPLLLPLIAPYFLQRRWPLRWAAGLGLVATAGLLVHYTALPLTALGGSADPDTAALYGWGQVAAAVEQQAESLEQPLLLTTDYRSAAALAYQLNNAQVLALSGRIDQFDFLYDPSELQGRDGVLLGESWHPVCSAHLELFTDSDPPVMVTVKRWGYALQTYAVMRVYGFRGEPSPLDAAYPLAASSDGETCPERVLAPAARRLGP